MHVLARFVQLSRNHETVPAIVSFAADDCDALGRGVLRQRKFGHGGARIFHQSQRGDTEALTGGAVNLAHFGRSDDFHGGSAVSRWS